MPTIKHMPKLQLEELDPRIVPATITWNTAIAPLGGDFNNPLNWVQGVVPGANDTAVIDLNLDGVLTLNNSINQVQGIITDPNTTLNVAGTSSLTLAGGNSNFSGPVVITAQARTTVTPGTNVVIRNNVNFTVDGLLTLDTPGTFAFEESGDLTPQILTVNGKFDAINANVGYFLNNSAVDPTRFVVNPGAEFRFVNSNYRLEQLVLANGSKVAIDGVTGSNFITELAVPADTIPLLANNLVFQNVYINPNSLTLPVLTLAPLGTSSTAQQYIFTQNFTVPATSTLNLANDSKILIGDDVTITADGNLNIGLVASLKANEANPAVGQGIVVNAGFTVDGATKGFTVASPNVLGDITSLRVGPSATFMMTNTIFAWDQLRFDNATPFTAATLAGNALDGDLFLAANRIPLIENNLRFRDVNLNPNSAIDTSLTLKPIGTTTTANQRFVFPGAFNIDKTSGVVVTPNTRVVIRDDATITVDGTFRLQTPGQFLIEESNNAKTQGVVVNGVFDVTNTNFSYSGPDFPNDKSQVVINSGATYVHDGGSFNWDQVRLESGSKSRIQFIALTSKLFIDSGASQLISFNDFRAVGANSIVATGNKATPILIPNNFWGTTQDSQINVRILDQDDNANLPDIVFQPILTAIPARPLVQPVSIDFSFAARNITLFADLSNPAGNISEGTVQFQIFNGDMVIGTPPAPAAVINGGASAQYLIPAGLPGGTYTIRAVYSGTGNFTSGVATTTLSVQATTTTINTAPVPAVPFMLAEQPVSLSATVTSPVGTISEGAVRFSLVRDGVLAFIFGDVAVNQGVAAATFALPASFPAGNYVVQSIFLGNQNFGASVDQDEPFAVTPIASAIVVNDAAARFSLAAQTVPLSAAVTSPVGVVNDGSVRFTILTPQGPLGTPVTAAVVNGIASVNYTLPPGTGVGNYTIRAEFTGNNLTPSTADSLLTVAIGISVTTVPDATVSVSTTGTSVPLSATVVSDSGPVEVGTVTFTILNGATPVGTPVTVTVRGGIATTNYQLPASTPAGNFVIRATYNGTPFLSGSSGQGTLIVQPLASTTTVNNATATFSPDPQIIALTANIAAAGNVVNEGQVVFTIRLGNQILGTATTGAVVNGIANANYILPGGTPVGSLTIVAEFASSNFFSTSSGSSSLTIFAPPPPPPLPPPATPNTSQYAVGSGAQGGIIVYNADGTIRLRIDPFENALGGVRVATADFNGDGIADVVAGTGPGRSTQVAVFDGNTGVELFRINPFETSFTGGVLVAAGDLNQDGIADLVISPDFGGGPRLRIFSGKGFVQIADFFGIDDPNFRGGALAAIGDVNGDGIADLVVAAGTGGGPRIATYDGTSLANGAYTVKLFGDFFAFENTVRNGASVAVGDLNGDGFGEIVAGAGLGGGPRVSAFDGFSLSRGLPEKREIDFFAGNPAERGGVRITVKQLTPGTPNLIAGSGPTTPNTVTAYSSNIVNGAPTPLYMLIPFPGFTDGVFVG